MMKPYTTIAEVVIITTDKIIAPSLEWMSPNLNCDEVLFVVIGGPTLSSSGRFLLDE